MINCSKLATLLDVTPRTIRNWATDPVDPLPGLRVKGIWLFNVEQVQEWLEKQDNTMAVEAMVDEILTNFTKGKKDGKKVENETEKQKV